MRGRNLLRVLGLGFGLAGAIGGTVGAGILRTPAEVAAKLPTPGPFLLVWLLGGLYALLCAFGVSELGTMMPRAGGYYVFARRALGSYAGFVVGWLDWVAASGSIAALALFFADTAADLAPGLRGHTLAVAAFVIFGLAGLHWRGIRWGSGTQQLTSLLKALGFVALVAVFLILGRDQEPSVARPTGSLLGATFLVLPAVIWTYDGWYGPIYFGEEFAHPERDLPRSILGSVVLVTVLYLLLNVALLRALPLEAIARAHIPAADAAAILLGTRGVPLLKGLIALSVLSTMNAMILAAPRILYALSKDRLLPEAVQGVNEGGTPTTALALTTTVAAAFLLSGTFEKVIQVVSFFIVAFVSLALISVFVLRHRAPDEPRPYRAWGHPFTTGLALLGSLAFFVGVAANDPRNATVAVAVVVACVPAYLLLKLASSR